MIDATNIKEYINQVSMKAARHKMQKAYYTGNNVAILQPEPKHDPDYRKPIPFARHAVNVVTGYMAKPGNIKYSGPYYDRVLKPLYWIQDEDLLTANELEDCLIYGECYELHWLDEQGQKNFEPIPVWQGLPVYDNDIRPKLKAFLWVRDMADGSGLATVYTETDRQDFYREPNGQEFKPLNVPMPHGYKQVPVNIGKVNRDKRNLFDHVLPLIDLYDKLISEDVANEAARFNAAILLMAQRIDAISQDDAGMTAIDRLKELRLIDDLGEGGDVRSKVGFVGRDIPTGFIEFATRTVERLIYEQLQIVNPNDDNFATASGVAQKYKLLGMEYLCASIEAYFARFLQNRIKLISGISGQLNESTDGSSDVQIAFDRNLPQNMQEIVDQVTKLEGIVTRRTQLKMLPAGMLESVEAELEALEEEAPKMLIDTVPIEQVNDEETDA
jgi:SPP1 family phage portal protein